MGIVLLEEEGKLSLDDDIRKHLPWMPDFGETITIRHCLNHTSGLRSLHALLAMAGWREDDGRTNEDLVRFVKKQRELNFKPGEEYLYCNTGYILMAVLIEELTGASFRDFMKDRIFTPMGMANTYVEDQYNSVVPNYATSYSQNEDGSFDRSTEYWGYTGSGNIHSSIYDLMIWMSNYGDPQAGWEDAFERMQSTVPLNDGNMNNYALGVNIGRNLDQKSISHGGAIGGFRSFAINYPEKQTSIIVLTNFNRGNPGAKAREVAKLIIGYPEIRRQGQSQEIPEDPPRNTLQSLAKPSPAQFAGTYFSPELDATYQIYVSEGELKGYHGRHGEFDIEVKNEEELEGSIFPFPYIKVIRGKKNRITGLRVSNGRVRNMWFEKVED